MTAQVFIANIGVFLFNVIWFFSFKRKFIRTSELLNGEHHRSSGVALAIGRVDEGEGVRIDARS